MRWGIDLLMANLIKAATGIFGTVLIIVSCLAVTVGHVYTQKAIAINGYLVSRGVPVKNGLITPFYDPPLTGGDVTEAFTTLEDGAFSVVIPWRIGRRIMFLIEDRPEGFYPVDLAKVSRNTNHRFFKGVILKEYVRSKELGQIDDFVKYGRVLVDVRNTLPWVEQKILSQEIYVRIKTVDDRITVCDSSFRPAYSKHLNKLVFNLPEGSWSLELYDTATGNVVLSPRTVVVSKSDPVELSLVKH